jgi:hypothetical protein
VRRAIVPRSEGRKLVNAYEKPQSCLELHYIAEDCVDLRQDCQNPKLNFTIYSSRK